MSAASKSCCKQFVFILAELKCLFVFLLQVFQQLCQRAEDISNSEYFSLPLAAPTALCYKTAEAWVFFFRHVLSHTSAFNAFFFYNFFLFYHGVSGWKRNKKILQTPRVFRPNLIFIHSLKEDVFFPLSSSPIKFNKSPLEKQLLWLHYKFEVHSANQAIN